jgi:hypothetical protein
MFTIMSEVEVWTEGIIFGNRDEYIQEVIQSAENITEFHPDLLITLRTDRPVQADCFDNVIVINDVDRRYRLPQVAAKVNAIPDLHVTTTRKHDSQIAPSLIKRNLENIDLLLGDKGYDDQKIRQLARQHEVRPLIKQRVGSHHFIRHGTHA